MPITAPTTAWELETGTSGMVGVFAATHSCFAAKSRAAIPGCPLEGTKCHWHFACLRLAPAGSST